MANINDLPNEILEFILSLLPPYHDLEQCSTVCKRWSPLTKNVCARKKTSLQKALIDFNLCWKQEIFGGSTPTIAARFAHATTLHSNSMYVFGGASSCDTTFNDLWRFDLSRRSWIRPISMGTYPSPKAGASLVCHNDLLILFGGWRHAYTPFQMCTLFDELHVYSVVENRWTIHNLPFGPPPMSGHSATIHRNKMIVFGGFQKMPENLGTSNDLWMLDLENLAWQKPKVSELKPAPRHGQFQMAIDEDHILVLGGTGGVNRIFHDAWLLDMTNSTWQWKRVQIRNKKCTVTHSWCYPSCSVGSKIVVLGPTSPNDFQIIRQHRPASLNPSNAARIRPAIERSRPLIPPAPEPNVPRANIRPELPPPAPALPVPVLPAQPLPLPPAPSTVASSSTGTGNVRNETKAGPSGLRPTNTPPSARPMPPIRSPFARQASEDDHLPKRFNQQPPEQSHMAMAAFSVSSSLPSQSNNSRERQLERLRKMEEKIVAMRRAKEQEQQKQRMLIEQQQQQQQQQMQQQKDGAAGCNELPAAIDPVTPKRIRRNGLAIYVCDISNLLCPSGDPYIEWQETKNSGLIAGAPDHFTFSTMIGGTGELIVFGGLNKNHKSENVCVSNSVHFLTVPTAIV